LSNAITARIREECLAVEQPRDLPEAQAATEAFVEHYNTERPHQGLACGNRPPRTALPHLPVLPPLPSTVDPDGWLQSLDGLHLERKIDANGMLSIDLKRYYVSRHLAGHRVSVQLDALDCCLHVFQEERRVKSLPVRGLLGQLLSFELFLAHMLQQARAHRY
jgi:integrase-like protein